MFSTTFSNVTKWLPPEQPTPPKLVNDVKRIGQYSLEYDS